MDTKIIELYDIFRTDLKLDDNRARVCAETFLLSIKEAFALQQAEHKSLFVELREDILKIDKKYDILSAEIEISRAELEKKIEVSRAELDRKIEISSAELDKKIEVSRAELDKKIEISSAELDKKIDNLRVEMEKNFEISRRETKLFFSEFRVELKKDNTNLFYLFFGLVVALIGLIVTIIIKVF